MSEAVAGAFPISVLCASLFHLVMAIDQCLAHARWITKKNWNTEREMECKYTNTRLIFHSRICGPWKIPDNYCRMHIQFIPHVRFNSTDTQTQSIGWVHTYTIQAHITWHVHHPFLFPFLCDLPTISESEITYIRHTNPQVPHLRELERMNICIHIVFIHIKSFGHFILALLCLAVGQIGRRTSAHLKFTNHKMLFCSSGLSPRFHLSHSIPFQTTHTSPNASCAIFRVSNME